MLLPMWQAGGLDGVTGHVPLNLNSTSFSSLLNCRARILDQNGYANSLRHKTCEELPLKCPAEAATVLKKNESKID